MNNIDLNNIYTSREKENKNNTNYQNFVNEVMPE